jgi:hypothetical protein
MIEIRCQKCQSLIGLSAIDLVRELAKAQKRDDKFRFLIYEPRPGVAERLGINPRCAFFSKTIPELLEAESNIDNLVGKLVENKTKDGSDPLKCYTAEPNRHVRMLFGGS